MTLQCTHPDHSDIPNLQPTPSEEPVQILMNVVVTSSYIPVSWSTNSSLMIADDCWRSLMIRWWFLMIVDDCWRSLMIVADRWWSVIIVDDRWWLLMIVDDRWWSLMILDDCWWLLTIADDRRWSLMIGDNRWWSLMIVDDRWWLLMIVDDRWQMLANVGKCWQLFPFPGSSGGNASAVWARSRWDEHPAMSSNCPDLIPGPNLRTWSRYPQFCWIKG